MAAARGVFKRRIEVEVVLLNVLAVVALAIGEPKEPFLKNGILAKAGFLPPQLTSCDRNFLAGQGIGKVSRDRDARRGRALLANLSSYRRGERRVDGERRDALRSR